MNLPPPEDADPSPAASGAGRWRIVGLLWVAYFLNQADRQIFGVTLPLVRADFHLTDTQMGLVATTFTIVFGLLVPFAGVAGDRFDRRLVVVLSLLLFSIGTLLTGFAGSFLLLLLYRGVATGAGEALYQPAASSLIAEHHLATRARALSIHQSANYVGVVLGSLFAGWIADAHGWRHAFGLFGAAGLFWALVLSWQVRRNPRIAVERPAGSSPLPLIGEAVAAILREPLLIAQVIGFSALVFVLVGYLTWMPTILYERFHLSLAAAGFSAVAYHHLLAALGLTIGSTLTDRLIVRMPNIRLALMGASLVACGLFLWMSAAAGTLILLYAALAAFGMFRGVYDANLFAAIFDLVEDRLRATVTGLIVAIAYLVGAISPVLMGKLKGAYGIDTSLHLLSVTAALAGLAFLGIVGHAGRRRRAAVGADTASRRP